jgi:MFS family permease
VTSESLRADGPRSPVDGPYAWFRLAISVLIGTIASIGMWSVVVVLPYVQTDFGIDRADASLPYTMTMIGFGLGNVVFGRFVDRFGIMLPVIVAGLALGAGFALAAMATAVWQLALAQGLLIGIGTSAGFGPMIANISHWFERRRGIAVATTASGNYIAGALWPTILQAGMESEGWRATYIGVGILCVATLVPLALLLRRNVPEDTGGSAAMTAPVAHRPVRRTLDLSPRALQLLLMVAGVGCCVAMSMPQVHIVAYCSDLGYGVARGAEMLSLMLVGGIVSRIGSGFLADKIGGVRTLLLGSVLQCLALILFLPFDGIGSLYVLSLLFGLSQGGIVPSYAIIIREYLPAREAGARVGLVIMATLVGMALGGWMSGWIFDATGAYAMAFVNGIAWNLLNLSIIVLVLFRTRGPRAAVA